MNPVDGNVKGDCTCRGCEASGTAISLIGLLSDKGTEVGVSVDGSEADVAARATDIDKVPDTISLDYSRCAVKGSVSVD